MNNNFIIKDITVSPLQARLNQPFRIATGQHDSLDNLLFTLELANGVKGYGEAAVATHITGETIPQTIKNLNAAGAWLIGRQAGDYMMLSGFLHERLAMNKSALAAIEMALLDALTRSLGMPLWRLWTDRPKQLRSDITIVVGSLEETVLKAKEFYAQGFRAFKIKVGRDFDLDVKRVLAISQLVKKSQLILDANQGFSAKQTLSFLRELSRARVLPDLIEQPVPKGDWEGLAQVTRSTKVCVCADESASSVADALRIIKDKSAGAINIKLMKTGIVHAVCIARWAKANNIKLMIGGMMESNLAMTASAHLAAGLGCFDFIDLDTPFFIKGAVAHNPYLSSSGVYDLSDVKAGIGIKFKPS